jgi:hypothetical protein
MVDRKKCQGLYADSCPHHFVLSLTIPALLIDIRQHADLKMGLKLPYWIANNKQQQQQNGKLRCCFVFIFCGVHENEILYILHSKMITCSANSLPCCGRTLDETYCLPHDHMQKRTIVLSGYKFGKGWALDMLKVPETGAS